jgi:hypothetical protein
MRAGDVRRRNPAAGQAGAEHTERASSSELALRGSDDAQPASMAARSPLSTVTGMRRGLADSRTGTLMLSTPWS